MRFELHDGYYLSPIIDGDQAAYIEHFSDKETTDRLVLIPYPYTQKDADSWVQSRVTSALNSRVTQFALRRPDGFLIGGIGLVPKQGPNQVDLGYWVARDYRRRGLASAAVGAMTRFAFNELGLKSVHAWVFLDNLPSQHLLEKAGFRRDPALAKQIKNGIAYDVYIYVLISPV